MNPVVLQKTRAISDGRERFIVHGGELPTELQAYWWVCVQGDEVTLVRSPRVATEYDVIVGPFALHTQALHWLQTIGEYWGLRGDFELAEEEQAELDEGRSANFCALRMRRNEEDNGSERKDVQRTARSVHR